LLNLAHLEVLAAAARHGVRDRSGEELGYSQPPARPHLSCSETATGAKLVQRVGAEHDRVTKAAATLTRAHPGIELSLIDLHPVEALQTMRQDEVSGSTSRLVPRPSRPG
jgi:hypothetical protein